MLEEFDIRSFLPENQKHFSLSGTVRCAPAVRSKIKLVLRAAPKGARSYDVEVLPANFQGALGCFLGPGDGRISIRSAGPIYLNATMWRQSSIVIGSETTMNGARIAAGNCDIEVGHDTLWSDGILVQGNDQHGIYDLKTRQRVRQARKKTVISDHTWIGRNATILPNVVVGFGSIVAAEAVVSKSVPEFSIVGGNPANTVSEGRTWSRQPDAFSQNEIEIISEKLGNVDWLTE